jgi:hypothetical protein
MEFVTFQCMDYIFVCDLCMCLSPCMNYVLDNLWCSNSKNLCVLMFIPILYVVFHPFSSMLQIVYVQNIYNVNKQLTTICMIFANFFIFFLGTAILKTNEISFVQNRSSKPIKLVGLLKFHWIYRSNSNISTF